MLWRMFEQQFSQCGSPAPQPFGAFHIQQQGLVEHRHIGGEAQRPPTQCGTQRRAVCRSDSCG